MNPQDKNGKRSFLRGLVELGILAALIAAPWLAFDLAARAKQLPPPESAFAMALRSDDSRAAVRVVASMGPSEIDRPEDDVTALTPLMLAIRAQQLDVVEALLERGASVARVHRVFGTPLMLAASMGDPQFVEALLRHGADPDAMTSQGMTPLIEAAHAGDPRCVRLLLDAGARPMPPGARENPLTSSGDDEYLEATRVLLECGLDPNRAGRDGELPLPWAVASGAPATAALLLSWGADPDRSDTRGRTARGLAARSLAMREIFSTDSRIRARR
jgi:ankyrin repeat protein